MEVSTETEAEKTSACWVVPWLRRLVTAEARVRARISPYGICARQSGTVTGFSPSSSVPLSLPFHRGYPYTYIIWGMNNKPVGGRSSQTLSSNRHEQHTWQKAPGRSTQITYAYWRTSLFLLYIIHYCDNYTTGSQLGGSCNMLGGSEKLLRQVFCL
jgi:hypothetical protein